MSMKTRTEPVRLADVLKVVRSAGASTRSLRLKKPLSDHPSKSTKRVNQKVRKQVFPHVDLGHDHPVLRFVSDLDIDLEILSVMLQDFDQRIVQSDPYAKEQCIDRVEDARSGAKEPVRPSSDDTERNEKVAIRKRVRTAWPLDFSNAQSNRPENRIEPRYPVPDLRPNRFLTEHLKSRRKLTHRKWLELNRTHNWPSWLVCDDDHFFTAEVLCWIYPNILTTEREKGEAAITLEAINVFLRGHKPSEDSPLYRVEEKSIARRVQRFLKEAEDWWKLESSWQQAEDDYDLLEASALFPEADEDDVESLWRKRLDDEE
jgi:hypothetical protein